MSIGWIRSFIEDFIGDFFFIWISDHMDFNSFDHELIFITDGLSLTHFGFI